MGSFIFNQDFSAKGVVKGMCVCGVAPETIPEAEKLRLIKKTISRLRFKHRDIIPVAAKYKGEGSFVN